MWEEACTKAQLYPDNLKTKEYQGMFVDLSILIAKTNNTRRPRVNRWLSVLSTTLKHQQHHLHHICCVVKTIKSMLVKKDDVKQHPTDIEGISYGE